MAKGYISELNDAKDSVRDRYIEEVRRIRAEVVDVPFAGVKRSSVERLDKYNEMRMSETGLLDLLEKESMSRFGKPLQEALADGKLPRRALQYDREMWKKTVEAIDTGLQPETLRAGLVAVEETL